MRSRLFAPSVAIRSRDYHIDGHRHEILQYWIALPKSEVPMSKIDIFPHIFPRAYYDKMVEIAPSKEAIRRWMNIPVLYELDARLRMMDEFGPEYQHILTLSMPAVEYVAPPEKSPDLAKLAND